MPKKKSKATPEESGGATQAGLQSTEEKLRVRKREKSDTPEAESDPWGDSELYKKDRPEGAFTPGELGEPEQADRPDADNPMAAQGGEGPLGQQGEGNRQSDELAELEEIEPDIDLGPKDR